MGIEPAPELSKLRRKHYSLSDIQLIPDKPNNLDGIQGDCLEILAEFESGNASSFGMELRCSPDNEEKTPVLFDAQNLRLISGDKFGEFQLLPGEKTLKLHVYLDKSVIEVYRQ